MLTLGVLWNGLTGFEPAGAESVAITQVAIDSRKCIPGSVFFALKGEVLDGHAYIGEALTRGAIAIVAEARVRELGLGGSLNLIDVAGLQPNPSSAAGLTPVFIVDSSLKALQQIACYWRSQFPNLVTLGITGSIGKSSTKELVYTVLKQKYRTLKNQGNLNSETGLPLTLFSLNEKYERAVLEMAMYAPGEIRSLCEIAQPRTGIVTFIGPSHLERLGSLENIANAKAELVEALPRSGHAILNGDDPLVRAMSRKTLAQTFFYGLNQSNDLWADDIQSLGLDGIAFALHYENSHFYVRVPLLGRHSVHTALAAAAAGLMDNLSWEEILVGLQDVSAQLRLIAVPGRHGITILDDTYNASPDSTLAALNLLSELKGRKVAVLGDMLELGSYEQEAHRLVGIRAAEVVDVIIAVGQLGRLIGDAARDEGHGTVSYVAGNEQAVALLDKIAESGDIVLIKGSRGAHMEDIVSELSEDGAADARATH